MVIFNSCVSRWAQVTEELRQALLELEEEKEKRREVEEEMNLKAYEQENLKNKLSALLEEREKEKAVMLTGKEAEISAETSLLVPATFPLVEEDKLVGELWTEKESAALLSHQKQEELLVASQLEMKQTAESTKQSPELGDDNKLRTLQVYSENKLSKNVGKETYYFLHTLP